MDFGYFMPTRVRFGCGSLSELGSFVRAFSPRKVLVCVGGYSMKKAGTLEKVLGMLKGFGVVLFDDIESDPSIDTVDLGVGKAEGCDVVIGFGGGSVLDAAKAVAMISVNGGRCVDYSGGKRIVEKGLPYIAIPTTAGTGSEVTGVTVITDKKLGLKRSFKSDLMYPDVALVDPELTLTVPAGVTAASGMDALTHAVESAVSTSSSPVTESFALKATRLVYYNLDEAFNSGKNINARENVMLGSTLAGLGFSNSGCGLVHALTNSIGGRFHKPHGVLCALLLPHVMEYNMSHAKGRYELVARALDIEGADGLVDGVRRLNMRLKMPSRLSEVGVRKKDLKWIAENLSGSIKTNPVIPEKKDLINFLCEIL